MALPDRVTLYKKIEGARERPLIVYVTSQRMNSLGLMASDAVPEILDQLSSLPTDATGKVDFLIASHGGDPTVAWRIMSLLRERFGFVSVLVPQAAFSAATLLALGADEIVMHPHSNLGPVDPQFSIQRPGTGEIRYGYEELSSFFEFAKAQGVDDQEQLRLLVGDLVREVGAIALGGAARGSKLLLSMGEQLLRMHMGEKEGKRAKEIAEKLNRSFAHHGYPLSRREAREIGLKIADSNPEFEKLIWRVWVDIEADLKFREPFNVVDELEKSASSAALFGPVPQLVLPANLPPAAAQQILQQAMQQVNVTQVPAVPFVTVHAVMESARTASRNRTAGRILASRLPDGQLQMNVITLKQGWESVTMPGPATPPPAPMAPGAPT